MYGFFDWRKFCDRFSGTSVPRCSNADKMGRLRFKPLKRVQVSTTIPISSGLMLSFATSLRVDFIISLRLSASFWWLGSKWGVPMKSNANVASSRSLRYWVKALHSGQLRKWRRFLWVPFSGSVLRDCDRWTTVFFFQTLSFVSIDFRRIVQRILFGSLTPGLARRWRNSLVRAELWLSNCLHKELPSSSSW